MTDRPTKQSDDATWVAWYEDQFRQMSIPRLELARTNLTKPGVDAIGDDDFRRYTRLQKTALGTVLGEDL